MLAITASAIIPVLGKWRQGSNAILGNAVSSRPAGATRDLVSEKKEWWAERKGGGGREKEMEGRK